jgi:glycosyltransferase involved in cell wall biosynthesis
MDYLKASDVLVHPSISDSSSVIIKESGLNEKPVIVCKAIGDVDDYLIDRENAFLVSKANPLKEMEQSVQYLYERPEECKRIGVNLKESVINRFSISKIISSYDAIHREIETK